MTQRCSDYAANTFYDRCNQRHVPWPDCGRTNVNVEYQWTSVQLRWSAFRMAKWFSPIWHRFLWISTIFVSRDVAVTIFESRVKPIAIGRCHSVEWSGWNMLWDGETRIISKSVAANQRYTSCTISTSNWSAKCKPSTLDLEKWRPCMSVLRSRSKEIT